MSYNNESVSLQHGVIEFLTVAVEYCLLLESAEQHSREEFVSTALKLLPLLYLKGSLLPEIDDLYDDAPSDYVTEENYNIVRNNIAYVLGSKDDFLDVFVEDMRYSAHLSGPEEFRERIQGRHRRHSSGCLDTVPRQLHPILGSEACERDAPASRYLL